jgi:hypothetical protein
LPLIPKAYKGLKNYFKKGKIKDTKLPDVRIKGDVKGRKPGGVMRETIEEAGAGRRYIQPIIDRPITSGLIATAGLTAGLGGINRFTGEPSVTGKKDKDKDKELTQEQKDYQALMDRINQANTNAASKKDKSTSFFSPTDLIQLGGTVMGAKNISELGQGIAGVAGLSSERKAAERKSGMEERYYKAQTEKINAEIEAMPLNQIIASLTSQQEYLKLLSARVIKTSGIIKLLQQQLSKIQGFTPDMIAGNNKNLISSFT